MEFKKFIIFYLTFWLIFSGEAMALSVSGLTVDTHTNPSGIDFAPSFGWKLQSQERGCFQTSYTLNIYSDPSCKNLVWTSGKTESDRSVNVKHIDFHPDASRIYYWRVTVEDNFGNKATSMETAYFETGVKGNWEEASWIRTGEYPYGVFRKVDIKNYSIDVDITILSGAAGLCFGLNSANQHYLWQINLHNPELPVLRILFGDSSEYSLRSLVNLGENTGLHIGQKFHLRLEVTGNGSLCTTFINGIKVGEHSGSFHYSRIGMRESSYLGSVAEAACFDNLKVTDTDTGVVWMNDLFFDAGNFTGGETIDGQLYLEGNPTKTIWQKSGLTGQTVEVDITAVKGNPALIFGASEYRNCFMWQIVLDEGTIPLLRRINRQYSNMEHLGDIPLEGYVVADFTGKEHTLKVDVSGSNEVFTYIDGRLVDRCTGNFRRIPIDKVGVCDFTPLPSEDNEAYFDNFRATYNYADGTVTEYLSEDFESETCLSFLNPEIVTVGGNRKCRVKASSANGYHMMQLYSDMPLFYTLFNIEKPVKRAVLHTSALGVYDLWVNGERVGHVSPDGSSSTYEELKPGWTDYFTRLTYSTHDVTHLCRQGRNLVGSIVTPGWARGSISKDHYSRVASFPAFIGKLVITYTDGSQETIGTDQSWRTCKSAPLLSGNIYEGEYYDATRAFPWEGIESIPAFNVMPFSYSGTLTSTGGLLTKCLEPVKPRSLKIYGNVIPAYDYGYIDIVEENDGCRGFILEKGQTAIIDFGQNMAALPRFKAKGKRGTRINIRFAEILNDSGRKDRYNDGPEGSIFRLNMRGEKNARLYYVMKGSPQWESYQTSTSYFGYRYCEITASDNVEFAMIESMPLTSSFEGEGTITTDNHPLNKLIENIQWGQRSNFQSIPTDCPSRDERLGWTGDIQIFSNTAMYNANVTHLIRKWLADLRDCQREDGCFPDIAPSCLNHYGSAAWADAGVIVPWNLYLMTGDRMDIFNNYHSMSRYMDYLSTLTDGSIMHPGAGTKYGDWLALENTSPRYISQAYYAYMATLMAKMSETLSAAEGDGYDNAQRKYNALFRYIRNEMQNMYFDNHGLIQPTQTACALALRFGICVDEEQRQKVANQLCRIIEDNGFHISTGFLGTGQIALALSENGHGDFAYNLLLQRSYPSWLYAVYQGATTVWERWNSYTAHSGTFPYIINSFNHYAYGAIAEWMYSNMLGIRASESEPGFKKIILRPEPDARAPLPGSDNPLKNAKGSVHSPYGEITAEWLMGDEGHFSYKIKVPANTTAEVYFPLDDPDTPVYEGDVIADMAKGVEPLGHNEGHILYRIGSGDYCFSTTSLSHTPRIEDEKKIHIYPNPARDILNIGLSSEQVERVTIFNTVGGIAKTFPGGCNVIDVSGLGPNLYILRIETKDRILTTSFIKKAN